MLSNKPYWYLFSNSTEEMWEIIDQGNNVRLTFHEVNSDRAKELWIEWCDKELQKYGLQTN